MSDQPKTQGYVPADANRLHLAAEYADNLRDYAAKYRDDELSLGQQNYLAGAEDALRWVLGQVPGEYITEILGKLGLPQAHRLEVQP